MEKFLRYLHEDTIDLGSVGEALDIYQLAHKVQFGSLLGATVAYFSENVSVETVVR